VPIDDYNSPAKSGRQLVQICISGAYLVPILFIHIVMRSEDSGLDWLTAKNCASTFSSLDCSFFQYANVPRLHTGAEIFSFLATATIFVLPAHSSW
jgi:hypothetical protein